MWEDPLPKNKRRKQTRPRGEPDGMRSIGKFCERNGISQTTYYELRKRGEGPRETRFGKKVFITHEAEAAWRKAHEA